MPDTFIKICGITDPVTAKACADMGANAVGMVFFEKSPRHVSCKTAAQITQSLPQKILKTGVFVNTSFEDIMQTVSECALTAVQLHGDESPDLVDALNKQGLVVIKALFAARAPLISQATAFSNAGMLLVEYGMGSLPGGNAEPWSYEKCLDVGAGPPVVLAGGLTADNVTKAITMAHPFGVDVSSGVETLVGIKSIPKIRNFIETVRKTGASRY